MAANRTLLTETGRIHAAHRGRLFDPETLKFFVFIP
jgi:hypothetical protein